MRRRNDYRRRGRAVLDPACSKRTLATSDHGNGNLVVAAPVPGQGGIFFNAEGYRFSRSLTWNAARSGPSDAVFPDAVFRNGFRHGCSDLVAPTPFRTADRRRRCSTLRCDVERKFHLFDEDGNLSRSVRWNRNRRTRNQYAGRVARKRNRVKVSIRDDCRRRRCPVRNPLRSEVARTSPRHGNLDSVLLAPVPRESRVFRDHERKIRFCPACRDASRSCPTCADISNSVG